MTRRYLRGPAVPPDTRGPGARSASAGAPARAVTTLNR